MTDNSRKEWQCYELLHGGEGPRGRDVVVMTPHYADQREAAEEAAAYFEGIDRREQDYGYDDADGMELWVEVADCGYFCVKCKIKATFLARKVSRSNDLLQRQRGLSNGTENQHRVDRRDLESRNGLHADQ